MTTSRVSSIARHFDQLSKAAERSRQSGLRYPAGRRARAVVAARSKYHGFDNVRDAFKDESDTESSDADDEEDEAGSDDSVDSAEAGAADVVTSPLNDVDTTATGSTTPIASAESPTDGSAAAKKSTHIDIPPAPDVISSDPATDAKSPLSLTDRLQIELPSFEINAPIPSMPVTPNLSADAAEDAHQAKSVASQMSESEMSSGGERSTIMKTLTNLWALRAAEFSPLAYPL